MLHTTTDDVFRLMLEVHNVAPFKIVREAAPYMRAKKPEDIAKNKSIVNVSSTSGKFVSFFSAFRATILMVQIGLQVSMAMLDKRTTLSRRAESLD